MEETQDEQIPEEKQIGQTVADQCQYGQCGGGKDPLRKRTRFISNGPDILRYLRDRHIEVRGYCSKVGRHGTVSGKKAAAATIYHRKLDRAIAKEIARQHERYKKDYEHGLNNSDANKAKDGTLKVTIKMRNGKDQTI